MYRHNHFSILLSELQEYHHLKKNGSQSYEETNNNNISFSW